MPEVVRRKRRFGQLLLLLTAGQACSVQTSGTIPTAQQPASTEPKAPTPERRCDYQARILPPKEALKLEVEVECSGFEVDQFSLNQPSLERFVQWHERGAPNPNRASYQFSIAEAGKSEQNFDLATHIDGHTLAPLSSWLVSPRPAPSGAQATLKVHPSDEVLFESGLGKRNGLYEFSVSEIRLGSYGLFSHEPPIEIELPRAAMLDADAAPAAQSQIKLAILPGAYAVSKDKIQRWVRRTAEAFAGFYAGFPARQVFVVLVPVENQRGAKYGKLLPAGGPAIVLLLGEETQETHLYDDWVLTHELFHLGVPSFVNEGKWLDEGLATYFEPLIRYRQGWLTEEQVWEEFVEYMPQGLAALESYGLENSKNLKDRYWGGAVFALLADLAAIQANGCGLRAALVAALKDGAEARRVWDLAKYITRLDRQIGTDAIQSLANRHAFSGGKTDFERQLAKLGVKRRHFGVELEDQAELADVRRALTRGVNCGKN